jgi:hypothetical protein
MGRGAAHGGREIGMGSSRRPDPALVEAGSGVEQGRSGAVSTRRGEEGGVSDSVMCGAAMEGAWRLASARSRQRRAAWDRGGARWGPVAA